jgi:hypothetical protein
MAEPKQPEKLEYADPHLDDDKGVQRYYREPPELEQLLGIAGMVAMVLIVLAVLALYLVRNGIGH